MPVLRSGKDTSAVVQKSQLQIWGLPKELLARIWVLFTLTGSICRIWLKLNSERLVLISELFSIRAINRWFRAYSEKVLASTRCRFSEWFRFGMFQTRYSLFFIVSR